MHVCRNVSHWCYSPTPMGPTAIRLHHFVYRLHCLNVAWTISCCKCPHLHTHMHRRCCSSMGSSMGSTAVAGGHRPGSSSGVGLSGGSIGAAPGMGSGDMNLLVLLASPKLHELQRVCGCGCVYVCVCVYVWVCGCTCVGVGVRVWGGVYVCTCVGVGVSVCLYVCTCVGVDVFIVGDAIS